MSKTNDGGPAFPRPASRGNDYINCDEDVVIDPQSGMSLRDWFAGQAMQAMVGSFRKTMRGVDDAQTDSDSDLCSPDRDMLLDRNGVTGEYDGAIEVASDAYAIADAMLAARERIDDDE